MNHTLGRSDGKVRKRGIPLLGEKASATKMFCEGSAGGSDEIHSQS